MALYWEPEVAVWRAPWDVARRVAETVPNDGLVRYYAAFSNERLLVTSPKAISEVLVNGAYIFKKTNLATFIIKRFTGNGLGFLDGEEDQVPCLSCIH
jgi:hypothetical protein